jgi:aerobic-type carbon monoxide dehydrogenase small subunit (CoxS/CutS family)
VAKSYISLGLLGWVRLTRKKPSGSDSGTKNDVLTSISSKTITRRTFLKATAGTAAVAGTAVLALEFASRAQSASTSSAMAGPSITDPFASIPITLNVNGKAYSTVVEPRAMLVNVIRERFNLTGTKRPCNRQECGGCTVLIDNKPFYSCTYLAVRAQGHQILTVEGTQQDKVLAALQTAWVPADASQCGYCQPGRIMAATGLLKSNPNPSVDQIKAGLEGVLCRCGTYLNAITAVQNASLSLQGVT